MARREMVVLEDDMVGGEAAETVKFALDGTIYEIDLNSKNAEKLRGSVARYVQAARRVGRGGVVVGGRMHRGGSSASDREQNKAIRAWARKSGWDIADRGRIPQEIFDEYRTKNGRRAG